jgi:hypothetical protein
MVHDHSTIDPDAALRRRAEQSLQYGFLVSITLIVAGVLLSAIRQEAFPDTLGTPLDSIRGTLEGDPPGSLGSASWR